MHGPRIAQAAALVIACLALSLPAQAQTEQGRGGTVRAGALRCDVAGSSGFAFGSTRDVSCEYVNVNGRRERYTGEISRYGVDLGFTQAAVMLWAVLAPTTDLQPGVLAGAFAGVSGGAAVGVGVGANVLVGGSDRSIALQPLSIEGSAGLNIALGVADEKGRQGAFMAASDTFGTAVKCRILTMFACVVVHSF